MTRLLGSCPLTGRTTFPGNPKMVVTNLPGAGSLTAWQNVMHKAPGTGLDIAVFSGGLLTQAVLGEKLEAFDPELPIYLGAPDFALRRSTLCVRTDTANSLDSFLKLNKKTRIAEASPGDWAGRFQEVAGAYRATCPGGLRLRWHLRLNAAFDKGELDLTDRCDDANLATFPALDLAEHGHATFLSGAADRTSSRRSWHRGSIPGMATFSTSSSVTLDQRMAFDMNNRLSTGERLFALPPKTPDNVANALTKSFYDTVADPEFRNAAVARNYDVGLKTGETLRQLIAEVNTLNPEVQSLLQQMYAINK